MVLQQDKPITVWGWAEAGDPIAVTLTQDPAIGEAAIPAPAPPEDDGSYSVTIQYVEKNASKLATQTVEATADANGRWSVKFHPAKASFQPTWIIAKTGDDVIAVRNVLIGEIWVCAGQSNMGWGNFNRKGREAASADFPGLRYVAWHDSWYQPLDDVRNNIHWSQCSPETAQGYSAIPYLYGTFLHRYLKVPVGIINVARGGTLGQTWCLREELEPIDNVIINTVLADYDAETDMWDDPKQVERIMADWEQAVEQYKVDHAKQVAEAKAAGKKQPRFRPPRQPGDPRSGWSPPAGLFNATIMPIRHLGIRGVLYYQGENQAFNRWTRYEYTFPKIPVSFRKAFGDQKLPFGCISQPGWGTFGLDPEISAARGGYHIVRDIQRRALKDDPHAGMIATYPTGNSYIHPAEKLPVAEYASLWALAKVYGEPVVHRANEYQRMEKRNGKIYLFFDSDPVVYERWKHIEKNAYWQVLPCPREGNAEFKGFTIAGADRRWYPAKAQHTRLDGEPCIELSSDLVEDPAAARYGWAQWPTGNMVGRERLPLPTFRTDDWPLPVGVTYTQEAQDEARDKLAEMMAEAERQALDRKVRQLQIDLPKLERELHLERGSSDATGLVASKIARIEAILDELQNDDWLSRRIAEQPELVEKIKAARQSVEAMKAQAARLE
jgi:sialate O-acetylesterase